jgi:peptidylprolyl isomerase
MSRGLLLLTIALVVVVGCGDGEKSVTTASGLTYFDQKVGTTGEEAKSGDWAQVHYTGWLAANNKQFDSSIGKKPLRFKIDKPRGVIAGWNEGVKGMKVGGKRRLVVPWKLAYGETGSGPIPPKADLVFEIELLGLEKPSSSGASSSEDMSKYVTTASGLKYFDKKVGTTGEEAKSGDWARVHYTGWFAESNEEFDSSVGKKPFPFQIDKVGRGGVIAGWNEGVKGMKVGGKRRLMVPWKLAYGEDGYGPIPPKADLIFEVELLAIGKKPPTGQGD